MHAVSAAAISAAVWVAAASPASATADLAEAISAVALVAVISAVAATMVDGLSLSSTPAVAVTAAVMAVAVRAARATPSRRVILSRRSFGTAIITRMGIGCSVAGSGSSSMMWRLSVWLARPPLLRRPGPCTCLFKTYTPTGLVVFSDMCTKESASAPVGTNTSDAIQAPTSPTGAQMSPDQVAQISTSVDYDGRTYADYLTANPDVAQAQAAQTARRASRRHRPQGTIELSSEANTIRGRPLLRAVLLLSPPPSISPHGRFRHPWRRGPRFQSRIMLWPRPKLSRPRRAALAARGPLAAYVREGRIPAVIYGGGDPAQSISLEWREVNKLIYAGHFLTTIYDIDVEGAKERVIPRDYQLDRVTDRPVHVDFLRLKPGSTLRVAIPVHFINQETSPGIKKGGTLNIVRHSIELKVPADAIPEAITIDIGQLDIVESVHISAVTLPPGCKPVDTQHDFTIATIAPPVAVAETPAAAAAAAPAAGGAAPAAAAGDAKAAPAAKPKK